tara:strand:+ start:25 stop:495 length:471 start_codon:yes stop_codon:yes gene_type:complete
MKFFFLNIFLAIFFLNSCAKPTVVDVVMPRDKELTCNELKEEFYETRRFKKEAEAVRQVDSGGNITRTMLFWPALVKTIHNGDVAIKAANDRAYHLIDIMKDKNCKETAKLHADVSKTDSLTISYEIERLHRLYKKGALTDEEFTKAKNKILESHE